MRDYLIIYFSLFTLLTFGQPRDNEVQKGKLYLLKENGDSILITYRSIADKNDTVYLKVEQIAKGKKKFIQNIKSLCYYPLEISKCPSDFGIGFYIKYDPAVRNGNKFLYILKINENKFKPVTGFRDLGMIENFTINDKRYFYSYASCGCADACWKSVMFKINDCKIDTLAFLSCDCSSLIEKSADKKALVKSNCDSFNTVDKFERIMIYWKEKIKNGL